MTLIRFVTGALSLVYDFSLGVPLRVLKSEAMLIRTILNARL